MTPRTIWINPDRLKDRMSLSIYMQELFSSLNMTIETPNDLLQFLKTVKEDVELVFSAQCIHEICSSGYAYRVLMVFGKAAESNSHIQIHFRP